MAREPYPRDEGSPPTGADAQSVTPPSPDIYATPQDAAPIQGDTELTREAPPGPASEADALRDEPESGRLLAEHMAEAGYQPIILFGNAASGKTTLILSLLATIRTEAQLEAALFLGDPVLDTSKKYGAFLWEQASLFFGLKTQQFLEGTASPRTNIELPFFIPLIFRPNGKPEVRIAFMESNGEWYRADRQTNRFFPPLRKQVEEFLRNYTGGILFIHLLPYTQRVLYSSAEGTGNDATDLTEASLAVSGALQAYDAVRPDKRNDRHLMLVTKWDAHSSAGLDSVEALHDHPDEVSDFVAQRYSQAFITFRGLGLEPSNIGLNGYCAGQISANNVIRAGHDSDMREAILRYPIGLWRWIYQKTLEIEGQTPLDPFPMRRTGPFSWIGNLLNRIA
ncbi:MAG: hypothetical protein QOH81_2345 [Sphingomonadales bacterium]|jgi:hypothetical protein|nr:hypothetical protein [Sphingomonadales bacterium]